MTADTAQGAVYKFRFLALIPAVSASSTIRGYAGIRLWNARSGAFRPRPEDTLCPSPKPDVCSDGCACVHQLLEVYSVVPYLERVPCCYCLRMLLPTHVT